MHKLAIVAFSALFLVNCQTPREDPKQVSEVDPIVAEEKVEEESAVKESGFDPKLAAEVGADEYGMRQYVFAYLKRGPNRDLSEEESTRLQRAHLNNIQRLAREGKLVLAGPFMDDGEIRGIYVFAVESLEEAEKIAMSDPAIEAGSLSLELHPWYGSAGLMKINEMHAKLAKKNI